MENTTDFYDQKSDPAAGAGRTDRDPTPGYSASKQKSKLEFFSMGRVAQNKPLGTYIVEIYPIEELPFTDKEVTENAEDYKSKGVDELGESYEGSTRTTSSIQAEWLPWGENNRKTAPDVRRGERVMILKYADDDKYYWFKMGWDELRKLETVIWAFSAHTQENVPFTPENTYYVELTSHKGYVRLHTSKANGELVTYDIEINGKKGHILITDDIGNFVSMDSKEHRIELKNTDGSHYDMNKRNLTITIPDTFKINTRQFIINSVTNDQHASAWHTTNSPNISHSGGGAGSRCTTSAHQIETTTMNYPDGHIIEMTQNRVIKTDDMRLGPVTQRGGSGGGGGSNYSSYGSNANPDPDGGTDIWGGRTAGSIGFGPIGRDFGDPDAEPNKITTIANEHIGQAAKELHKVKDVLTEIYGTHDTKAATQNAVVEGAWEVKAALSTFHNDVVGDNDITANTLHATNITYRGEWTDQNADEAAQLLGLKNDVIALTAALDGKVDK